MNQDKAEVERLRELARVNRFKDFTDGEIAAVVEAATYVTVPDGWALMAEHTPADKAYLILSGSVSVRKAGLEIAQLGAGDIIGEMGLVDHRLRSATVVSLTRLEALHFTAETVDALQAKIPNLREVLTATSEERHP